MPHPAENDRALADPPEPQWDRMSPLGRAAVREAYRDLGVREVTTNRGPRVDELLIGPERSMSLLCALRYRADPTKPCGFCAGLPEPTERCLGCPWCARSLRSWTIAGAEREGIPHPLVGAGSLASAWKVKAWAERVGRWRSSKLFAPEPGWWGCLLKDGQASGHMTALTAVLDPAEMPARSIRVVSIEGNSGDMVRIVQRMWSEYAGGVDLR